MINKYKNKNTSYLFEVITVTHITYNCVKVAGLELVMSMQPFLAYSYLALITNELINLFMNRAQ